VRIIAGTLKSRRLATPGFPGLRPTSDKLRETLFNVIAPRVAGANVLDGFAGTGALGIEALSRGAAHVTFVDADRRAIALVGENVRRCGVADRCVIILGRLIEDSRRLATAPFDLILLDPPYAERDLAAVLNAAAAVLAQRGLVVLEHARRREGPESAGTLTRTRRVTSGDSVLAFYERGPQRGDPEQVRDVGTNAAAYPRVAVYPGSFDPLTNGHVDIIERGARIFDLIIVAILVNVEKAPLFTMQERVEIAREVFKGRPNVEVDTFDGLLVEYVARRQAHVIVRGLRAVSDFETEFQMALMNRRLDPRIETVFMMPAEQYSYISSRLIKEVFSLGGRVSGLVPETVERRLREKSGAVRR
jgi:pantetheine-phosphate adenylyltransferase